jgi:hypothetical protein
MASTKLRGGKLVHRFRDEKRKIWHVYEADRHTHPHLFDGAGNAGCTWLTHRKIYLDSNLGSFERFETLIHELVHATMRELNMNEFIEEAFVENMSYKLARYLDQCLVGKVH